ncbi:hypothetical protein AVEN_131078-1 [Araneus ventricosus]|uniref:Uncharacterized protein n=1 Tax=Araneus ventricosus TaxID=182803 RepID=A0A4Y2D0R0_ARAVE|nr:hypothetical protein AVEN_131078-1 [Araneus ventricosus]
MGTLQRLMGTVLVSLNRGQSTSEKSPHSKKILHHTSMRMSHPQRIIKRVAGSHTLQYSDRSGYETRDSPIWKQRLCDWDTTASVLH